MTAAESVPHPCPESEFRVALAQGSFLIQRCTDTGKYVFYPRAISPWSGKPTLVWVAPSGLGRVYSTTIVRRKNEQGGDYNVALIELDEGPRLMSRVEDIPPADVTIGMAVRAAIRNAGSEPVLVFLPVSDP